MNISLRLGSKSNGKVVKPLNFKHRQTTNVNFPNG